MVHFLGVLYLSFVHCSRRGLVASSIRLIQKERQNLLHSGTTCTPILHACFHGWKECIPRRFLQFPLRYKRHTYGGRHYGVLTSFLSWVAHTNTFDRAFAVLAHLPLWLATLWKRRETDGVEVARIVVHEGGWSFGLLTIYIGGILSYCVVSPGGNPFAVFVLPSVAFSMASCRMIIRMRALSPASPRQGRTFNSGSSIAFTTFINSHFTIEEGQVDQPKDKPKDDEQKEENEQKKDEPKEDKPTEEDEPKEDEKREGDERNEEEQNEEEQNEHEQNEDEQHQDEQNQEQNQDEQNEEDAQNEDEVKEDEPKEDEPKEDEPQEDESKHKLKDDEPKDEPQEDEPKHKPKDDEPYDETQILPAGDGSP